MNKKMYMAMIVIFSLLIYSNIFSQEKIIYTADRNGTGVDLWIYDINENENYRITSKLGRETFARISPDGTKLLYTYYYNNEHSLWIRNLDGSEDNKIISNASQACWSPNGSQIIYHEENGNWYGSIYKYDIDTQNSEELLSPISPFTGVYPSDWIEGKILYWAVYGHSGTSRAFLMDENGANSQQLSDKTSNYPRFNYDGSQIAFMEAWWDLRIINTDGSPDIIFNVDDVGVNPITAFSPDGTKIVFKENKELGDVYIININESTWAPGTNLDDIIYVYDWGYMNFDSTPPELNITLNPNSLWPPNHKLVDILASVTVTDDNDPNPIIELVSIESNEPDNGLGDGDKPNDIQEADFGQEDYDFKLRSERSGNGNGRVYTITYSATDESGNSTTATATVSVPHDKGKVKKDLSISDLGLSPDTYSLLQNYPNPFNPETEIYFQIPEPGFVELKIYNTLGIEIKKLISSQYNSGFHSIKWNGLDEYGNQVSSGIYLYHLKAGEFTDIKKMSLMR